jgi:hypothetical protein
MPRDCRRAGAEQAVLGIRPPRRHQCAVVGRAGEKRAVTWENPSRSPDIDGYDGVKTGTATAAGRVQFLPLPRFCARLFRPIDL